MNITILGSTGSIGVQTLDVVRNLNANGYSIKIVALSANVRVSVLEKQIREFNPLYAYVNDISAAKLLRENTRDLSTKILTGQDELLRVAETHVDLLINALVGKAGVLPTIHAIYANNNIALANKESLVIAGELITKLIAKHKIKLLPIDSEHSAIFQALMGNDISCVEKIYLTASGGPFHKLNNLSKVTLADALNHPTWKMGKKITIDSATMMNKGFEVIEAMWLFNLHHSKIKVVVHPQSIIHSMIQYNDGSIIAQLGASDMRIPIQFALTYPKRITNNFERLDFFKLQQINFEAQNELLCGVELCKRAIDIGGTMPGAVCVANDLAVEKFLAGEINFIDIFSFVSQVINSHTPKYNYLVEDVISLLKE